MKNLAKLILALMAADTLTLTSANLLPQSPMPESMISTIPASATGICGS